MPSRRDVLRASAIFSTGILPDIESIFTNDEKDISKEQIDFTWRSQNDLLYSVEFGYSPPNLLNKVNRNPINVVFEAPEDPASKEFARELEKLDEYYGIDLVTETIRSVRQNTEFVLDYKATPFPEFPRHPSETVQPKSGDCTDMVILASGALTNLDIDHYVILYVTHAAILIREEDANGDSGLRYEIDGDTYAYTELTSNRRTGNTAEKFMDLDTLFILDPFEKEVVRSHPERLPSSFLTGGIRYFTSIF